MTALKKLRVTDKTNVKVAQILDEDGTFAQTLIRPEVQAAFTIQKLQSGIETTATALTKTLIKQTANVSMARPEAMLLCQAHTLDALFNQLAQKALVQGQMPHYEAFMKLAFKAQSQCRATLETLSTIKNPPVIFAKQANISTVNQLINNTVSEPRTEINKSQSNELLTGSTNAKLDTRRKGKKVGAYSELEAVG